MQLKEYQQKALKQVEAYLQQLSEWRKKADNHPDLEINFPKRTWTHLEGLKEHQKKYHSKNTGIGQPLPNFCLKIPTGGGKTLLAIKTLDLTHTYYLRRQTGLVLWIVPSTQIYRQTIRALRDRAHPYRQHLDIASGGRTLIIEKTDRFSPQDVLENMVVLMLMLPSAARQNKETLKVFRDSGGFQDFFPLEDDIKGHQALLGRIPNLDHFGTDSWYKQIKTSLGNTLRLLSPVIILDEGQKAYSETAQATLCGFNPSVIVELSATPPKESNVLVEIRGRELEQEDMIKLDLHIRNVPSMKWQDTLAKSVLHLNHLQKLAEAYRASSGVYIRPIMLIQVERTGREQRDDKRLTHSEQIKEHLMKVYGIAEQDIAIKTSEKDELKDVDDVGGLLSEQCTIRFIITKQALQEGWDCSFAYILTILTNPGSKNALTQLTGRILRQPYARKLPIEYKELNESYVFTYQQRAENVLNSIKDGFELDGLGDLAGRVTRDDDADGTPTTFIAQHVRAEFQKLAQTFCLPMFAIREGKDWRPVSYEMDIARYIDWTHIDISHFDSFPLTEGEALDFESIIGLGEDLYGRDAFVRRITHERIFGGMVIYDPTFLARHLCEDIIPNPWTAYELGRKILDKLMAQHGKEKVVANFVYLVQEAKRHFMKQKNELARDIFETMMVEDRMRFIVIADGFDINRPRAVKETTLLNKKNGKPLQRSLFEPIMEDEFDTQTEREVAYFLEEQENLFWWYRNIPKQDYYVQGWQKGRIYPDLIFTRRTDEGNDHAKVFVVEVKGLFLDNPDTAYKQAVFEICNEQAVKHTDLGTLHKTFNQRHTKFKLIFENEWQQRLTEFLQ